MKRKELLSLILARGINPPYYHWRNIKFMWNLFELIYIYSGHYLQLSQISLLFWQAARICLSSAQGRRLWRWRGGDDYCDCEGKGRGGNSPVGRRGARGTGGKTCTRPFCLLSFHVAAIAAHDLSDFGLRIEYFIEEAPPFPRLDSGEKRRKDGKETKEKKKEKQKRTKSVVLKRKIFATF